MCVVADRDQRWSRRGAPSAPPHTTDLLVGPAGQDVSARGRACPIDAPPRRRASAGRLARPRPRRSSRSTRLSSSNAKPKCRAPVQRVARCSHCVVGVAMQCHGRRGPGSSVVNARGIGSRKSSRMCSSTWTSASPARASQKSPQIRALDSREFWVKSSSNWSTMSRACVVAGHASE